MIKAPMLAASQVLTDEDLDSLSFPVWVTIKKDGVRGLTTCSEGKVRVVSRKLIPLPNMWLQQWAEDEGVPSLDGEIVIPGMGFNDIQSFCMSGITLPKSWEYHVFDYSHLQHPYLKRLQLLQSQFDMYGTPSRIKILRPKKILNSAALREFFEYAILFKEEEGLIVRDGNGIYKEGRCTFNEQNVLKLIEYATAEATVIGFKPEYENQNAQEKDNLGKSKRSSCQAGLQAKERLGALLVRDEDGRKFAIGSGFSAAEKEEIWRNRRDYLRAVVTYRYKSHGEKENPRQPSFKSFRLD